MRIHREHRLHFSGAWTRTRSALAQIKGVFPGRTVERFAPRFAWLGQITSDPRDFDVYLLGFDGLIAQEPVYRRDASVDLRSLQKKSDEKAPAAFTSIADQVYNLDLEIEIESRSFSRAYISLSIVIWLMIEVILSSRVCAAAPEVNRGRKRAYRMRHVRIGSEESSIADSLC